MKNFKKKKNQNKYEDDDDDISISSLFSPAVSEISEPPTFLEEPLLANQTFQLVSRKDFTFGIKLKSINNIRNGNFINFLPFSSNKSPTKFNKIHIKVQNDPESSIFSLPSVNPNRKIIKLNTSKPIQIMSQQKTLVVKTNQSKPDLFTKINN